MHQPCHVGDNGTQAGSRPQVRELGLWRESGPPRSGAGAPDSVGVVQLEHVKGGPSDGGLSDQGPKDMQTAERASGQPGQTNPAISSSPSILSAPNSKYGAWVGTACVACPSAPSALLLPGQAFHLLKNNT